MRVTNRVNTKWKNDVTTRCRHAMFGVRLKKKNDTFRWLIFYFHNIRRPEWNDPGNRNVVHETYRFRSFTPRRFHDGGRYDIITAHLCVNKGLAVATE